jgi:hypothetical protein
MTDNDHKPYPPTARTVFFCQRHTTPDRFGAHQIHNVTYKAVRVSVRSPWSANNININTYSMYVLTS